MTNPFLLVWPLLLCCYGVTALDFLIFALQHPAGYCRSTFKNRCQERNMRDHFTIHGLWPSSATSGDKSLENCPVYDKFNVGDLAPIRSRLEEVWPSAKTNNPVQFWAHEWKRHGTCGLSIPALTGVLNYFNTTLQLFKRFELTKFLANDDIVPSTKIAYSVAEMQHAFVNDLHARVNLVCDHADGFKYPILTEVRACLNPDLLPIDCPIKRHRCGKDKLFFLPLHGDGRISETTNNSHSSRFTYGIATSLVVLLISSVLIALHMARSRVLL